jgi:formylglycine-generating enzyme required for sulfatase activity
MTTANWPLTVAPPTPGGYRLPTEAEWERAAAWDGYKHWIYGYSSNTNSGINGCNDVGYFGGEYVNANPLGLTDMPYTSPVGWFNGVNVSPHFDMATFNSVSPIGCYDMSGNVSEWCGDWYGSYDSAAQTNPTGSASSPYRVHRGGWWNIASIYNCRSACRASRDPATPSHYIGFRVAMSVASD